MLIDKLFAGRFVIYAVLFILTLPVIAGCQEAPSESAPTATRTPLATLAPALAEWAPTPTLAPGAPTRILPTPLVSPTPTATVPTPTPSATPIISDRLAIGDFSLEVANFELAAEQFSKALRQEPGLEEDVQAETLLKLGRSYLAEEQFMDAATIFNQLLALEGVEVPAELHFWLGEAYAGQTAYEQANEAYLAYLAEEPRMGGYVYPRIAAAHQALDNGDSAIQALESALEAPAILQTEIETRLVLAEAHKGAGGYAAAIEQYDIVRESTEEESIRGQMTYLAGAAELAAGNVEAANERFLTGVNSYPEAYESYLGLVELVKGEVPVDDYQRGIVDYYAAAYAPGIEALQAHIEANPESYNPEAHLYLARSHEALGDMESAFADMEEYVELQPQAGLMEEAKMRARSGDGETAAERYEQFVEAYPEDEEAPFAAWWLAAITAELDDVDSAIAHYVSLADLFPEHIDAPEALYVAGSLAAENDEVDKAVELWARAAESYPDSTFGGAALLELVRAGPDSVGDEIYEKALESAESQASTSYGAVRARDIVVGHDPFESKSQFVIPDDESQEQEAAELWLSEQFDLDAAEVGAVLNAQLLQDDRLAIGQRLWELGLYEEAKRELEELRIAFVDDPLSTYQLALFLRDLGLYRSSIIAAATLLNLAEVNELQAPVFIGRLVYPVYYAELITDLAEEHGYDPRLQFSLVRQESLFESLARSGAAAQGLSQVIPETGAWIAERLQWPDYENEDLYKPYVGLTFGAFYLAEQLALFDGDVHAALAAYNGGPGNALRWYEEAGSDFDQFVDTIDFWETRTYVQRIYVGFDLYNQLYGGT